MGFPGTLVMTAVYALGPDGTLGLDVTARTDRPTVVNPTQHAYVNPAGAGGGSILRHMLRIDADHYPPDSPSQPDCPSTTPRPGEVLRTRTEWHFPHLPRRDTP
jgi:aldose 1-epimerase